MKNVLYAVLAFSIILTLCAENQDIPERTDSSVIESYASSVITSGSTDSSEGTAPHGIIKL